MSVSITRLEVMFHAVPIHGIMLSVHFASGIWGAVSYNVFDSLMNSSDTRLRET
jgi:hypothetical protein